jgi:alpha-ketoglutarate-dependent taurine dioxygenase
MAAVAPLEIPYAISPVEADPPALPLVVEPRGDRDLGRLCAWLRANAAWVQDRLALNGAILFRGFDVPDAAAFERLARAIDDELKNEYLGTSPRTGLTRHVFTASELPGYYPIPQHCEMSFTASPPRRLFFSCLREPAAGTGETPLADFRRVWRDLDAGVRERFERGGIRIVRNYTGPQGGGRFDLFQLKRWDEMFLTTDRAAVEATCRREGFEPHWLAGGRLRLVSTQPVTRDHPVTGERVWHNHVTTFHLSAAAGEYARIFRLRPSLRSFAWWQLSRALVTLQRATKRSDDLSMHCTYRDGREIPDADVEAVRAAVWKNLVIVPWRRGDVVAIDNHSVSHGRLPYSGPREIAVCWA